MYRILFFLVFCYLADFSISVSHSDSGFQGKNQWGNSNFNSLFKSRSGNNEGDNGGFKQNSWSVGNNDGFGKNSRQNAWKRGSNNGQNGQSWPVNSYNTREGNGFDYIIPGAKVHFAAIRGVKGNSFGHPHEKFGDLNNFRGNSWQSRANSGENNKWSQQNSGFDAPQNKFGSNSPRENFGRNFRSQKNFHNENHW